MSFQSRLKEKRKELNLSRGDLAQKLGITTAAISNYENGISSPKEEILYKIFDVLKVEPNFLFQDETSHFIKERKVLTTAQKELLNHFDLLNAMGQQEALKRMEELTYITKYQLKKETESTDKTVVVALSAQEGGISYIERIAKQMEKGRKLADKIDYRTK